MTRITSLVICALMLGLFVISQSFSSPNGSRQNQAPAGLEEEIKRVEAEIDRIFAETLAQLPSIPGDAGSRMKRVQTLGKLMLFDKQLSVNRNQACTFCHMPDVDFTGPISILNMTTVAIRDRSEMRRRTLRSRDTATGNLRVTPTRLFTRPFSTT